MGQPKALALVLLLAVVEKEGPLLGGVQLQLLLVVLKDLAIVRVLSHMPFDLGLVVGADGLQLLGSEPKELAVAAGGDRELKGLLVERLVDGRKVALLELVDLEADAGGGLGLLGEGNVLPAVERDIPRDEQPAQHEEVHVLGVLALGEHALAHLELEAVHAGRDQLLLALRELLEEGAGVKALVHLLDLVAAAGVLLEHALAEDDQREGRERAGAVLHGLLPEDQLQLAQHAAGAQLLADLLAQLLVVVVLAHPALQHDVDVAEGVALLVDALPPLPRVQAQLPQHLLELD